MLVTVHWATLRTKRPVDVVAVTEAVRNVSVVDRMSADLAVEVFISTQRRAPVWKPVPLVVSMTRVSTTKIGLPIVALHLCVY